MTGLPKGFHIRRYQLALSLLVVATLVGVNLMSRPVSANHPVLGDGNCDSPIPLTTIVALGPVVIMM